MLVSEEKTMKMIIRTAGKGDVLAELDLKGKTSQADLDFLRCKIELAFAELHEQEVVACYDFEEQAIGTGLVFQSHPFTDRGPVGGALCTDCGAKHAPGQNTLCQN